MNFYVQGYRVGEEKLIWREQIDLTEDDLCFCLDLPSGSDLAICFKISSNLIDKILKTRN